MRIILHIEGYESQSFADFPALKDYLAPLPLPIPPDFRESWLEVVESRSQTCLPDDSLVLCVGAENSSISIPPPA